MFRSPVNGSLYDFVRAVLVEKPDCRDCDRKLVTTIWHRQLSAAGCDPKSMSVEAFFLRFRSDDSLWCPESIRRCRQKLQEECPELRGLLYKKRQQKARDVSLALA
jgi:hypothetical protein